MAGTLGIIKGTKIQLGFDEGFGKPVKFNMFCTFNKELDESSLLISVPMMGGKKLVLDETQKIHFQYSQGSDILTFAGYADAQVKEGIRTYWKIRRVNEQRKFFKRKDERYKVALKLQYKQSTWKPDADGKIPTNEAMTVDISAGGIAMYTNRRFDVGEFCEIDMPRVGLDEAGAAIPEVVGVVCWNREAPKGSMYRNVCGIQFKYANADEHDRMHEYVDYLKDKFNL